MPEKNWFVYCVSFSKSLSLTSSSLTSVQCVEANVDEASIEENITIKIDVQVENIEAENVGTKSVSICQKSVLLYRMILRNMKSIQLLTKICLNRHSMVLNILLQSDLLSVHALFNLRVNICPELRSVKFFNIL